MSGRKVPVFGDPKVSEVLSVFGSRVLLVLDFCDMGLTNYRTLCVLRKIPQKYSWWILTSFVPVKRQLKKTHG